MGDMEDTLLAVVVVCILIYFIFYLVGRMNKKSNRYQYTEDVNYQYNNTEGMLGISSNLPLEQDVLDSHAEYASHMDTAMGPSRLPERDDPNDTVGWVGLRRPNYQHIEMDGTARTETTEDPWQMPVHRQFTWN